MIQFDKRSVLFMNRILKKSLIIFSIIILLIISVFIINYLRLYISYIFNKKDYIETFDVQGNKSKYVPQGLCYCDKYNIALQTSYNSNGNASMLFITDIEKNTLIKSLKILDKDGKASTSHVGGIATDNSKIWITSDYEVNEFNLDLVLNSDDNVIKPIKSSKLPIRGDFCTYNNETLWIGDFFLNPFYKVPNNNPLLLSYQIGENIDYNKPDYAISLPKMVQGLAITDNNEFVFTRSFTYLIKSDLVIYNNLKKETNEIYNLNGYSIPYYKPVKSDLIKRKKLPPMAEGLFYLNNHLYILFENSSDKYNLALPKINKVIRRDREVFEKIKNKKVVINKSMISNDDIAEFAGESGLKIFSAIRPFNDRSNEAVLTNFLNRIGVIGDRDYVPIPFIFLYRRERSSTING